MNGMMQEQEVHQHEEGAGDIDRVSSQYLTFLLAGEEYGINILEVQEIKGWEGTTVIPNTPQHVLGVVNLRGTIVPVIELRKCFGLPDKAFDETTVVIMVKVDVEGEVRVVGVVVDAVAEVYNVIDAEIEPPPPMHEVVDAEYIRGLATLENKMVILLDIASLVAVEGLESELSSIN